MGRDDIVLWLSPELALGYWIAVIVGVTALLQVVAARWDRENLLWLPRPLAAPLGLLGSLGALLWFYSRFYRLIFVPGPAGLELMILFGSGAVLAIWLTRALHWLATRLRLQGAVVPRSEEL